MQLYLPIAEMTVDVLLILALGGAVGFLSGLFGVGGGFLMTPLLIFIGVPAAIAVGTQANQLVAASVSGVLAHWKRRNVDVKLGTVMLSGSLIGSGLGVYLFGVLQRLGQIDLVISILYVLLLGGVGSLMVVESTQAFFRRRRKRRRGKLHRHGFLHGMPFKMRFPASRLYVSALLPAGLGFIGGLMVSVLGIGGGFLLVPAMLYLLNMPAALVAGTSLFQIIFTTAFATVLQATINHTVDIFLAGLLIIGSVIGAQFGTRAGTVMRGEQARLLLGAMVLLVAIRLAVDLFVTPTDAFSIETVAAP